MEKTRVADYIADYIYKLGVHDVFMVSGGGMMFLSDGLASHPKIRTVCCHHEQAVAMGAVGYAKYREDYGAAYVTTGCGGTNAVTGLLDAWQDNVPVIFISGQTKRAETVRNSGLKLRQFGVQEADILPVISPLCKYTAMVNEPEQIRYHLDKAAFLAKSGRPGPVWLDIPMDVQASLVEPARLRRYTPPAAEAAGPAPSAAELKNLAGLLAASERPIVIVGQGVRLSGTVKEFTRFVEKLNIPVVASRLGINTLPSAHPLFVGRIGNKGDRAGNFALQNSDLVISLGSRLSVAATGHDYKTFAREAKLVVVDIDPEEHRKKTVRIDAFIHADLRNFFKAFPLRGARVGGSPDWTARCRGWKARWPVCLPEYYKDRRGVNLYCFVEKLCAAMKRDAVVISDAGSSFYVVSQGIQLADGQRYVTSGGQADMGFGLPAAIGVSVASGRGEALCVTGDGSLQMNLQELQTLVQYSLPVKLFVWNNDGYLSIRATQAKFFDGRYIGTDSRSGVSFPNLEKLARAYGLPYVRISSASELRAKISRVLRAEGPVVCEVMCIRDQEVVPSVSSRRMPDGRMVSMPLEDMYPFLDREEFRREMVVDPVGD